MIKQLIIIRGVSGAGKSSLAAWLAQLNCGAVQIEADDWMTERGEYKFERSKLGYCHKMCQENTELLMSSGVETVIVSNTSTTERELAPYLEMADKYNYKVVSLIVENRHGNKSVHNVSEEVLEMQANRFSIKLK